MHRGCGGRKQRGNARKMGNSSNDDNSAAGSSRSKNRKPDGLKGREIGLFYAKRSKEKQAREAEELLKRTRIKIDEARQEHIWKLLGNTRDIANSDKNSDKYENIADSSFKRSFMQNIEANKKPVVGKIEKIQSSFERNEELDRTLLNEYQACLKRDGYCKMLQDRNKLPAANKKLELLKLLEDNQVIVISGETGCGKTTQVPQFILDDIIQKGNGSMCRIVCTQPRRISAISVAQRVADERNEKLGHSVGYQIRLECQKPRNCGSILYCTTGILLQWLQNDTYLKQVSHLIIDEIHERDILSDFILTIAKDILPLRPDIKIVLMSATLNAKSFSKYFYDCPMLHIPGFTFPVETFYLEDALQKTKFYNKSKNSGPVWTKHTKRGKEESKAKQDYLDFMDPFIRKIEKENKYDKYVIDSLRIPESEDLNLDLITTLVEHICNTQPEGAVLIFLPGWAQISKLYNQIINSKFYSKARFIVLPLHSSMPTINQREIFMKPRQGVRKIVIATNIAETSITIDDVVYVVDCGKIKMTNYDVKNNIQTLQPQWVSLANAVQRRGRAGRVQPGVCFHLFSRRREMILEQYPLPEMLRSRLDQVILQLKILKLGLTKPFLSKVLDPPDTEAVDQSIKLLETLNALDENENLTPLGFHLAQLPMDPQTGKMILLAALFSCVDPVLSVAASLSHKDAFTLPLGHERRVDEKKCELSMGQKSDHLVFVEVMKRWERAENVGTGRDFCWEHYLSGSTLVMLRNLKKQLAEYLQNLNFLSSSDPKHPGSNINSSNRSLVKAIVCAGLYPNVAVVGGVKRIKNTDRVRIRVSTVEDGRVDIHPKSVNAKQCEFESPYLLYHLKLRSTAIFLHDTTMVYPLPLLFFGGRLKTKKDNNGDYLIDMDSVHIYCSKDISSIIKELRKRLDALLEYKISHPGVTDWAVETRERDILQAIVELITVEDKSLMLHAYETYSDDDDY